MNEDDTKFTPLAEHELANLEDIVGDIKTTAEEVESWGKSIAEEADIEHETDYGAFRKAHDSVRGLNGSIDQLRGKVQELADQVEQLENFAHDCIPCESEWEKEDRLAIVHKEILHARKEHYELKEKGVFSLTTAAYYRDLTLKYRDYEDKELVKEAEDEYQAALKANGERNRAKAAEEEKARQEEKG